MVIISIKNYIKLFWITYLSVCRNLFYIKKYMNADIIGILLMLRVLSSMLQL